MQASFMNRSCNGLVLLLLCLGLDPPLCAAFDALGIKQHFVFDTSGHMMREEVDEPLSDPLKKVMENLNRQPRQYAGHTRAEAELLEKHWRSAETPDSVVGRMSLTFSSPASEVSEHKSEAILQEQIAKIAGVQPDSVRLFAQAGSMGPTSISSTVPWGQRAFFAVVVVTYAIDTNSTEEAEDISQRIHKADTELMAKQMIPKFARNGVSCQRLTVSAVTSDVASTKIGSTGQSHFIPFAAHRRLLFISLSGVALFSLSMYAWKLQKSRDAPV